jgi:hypothetical protein
MELELKRSIFTNNSTIGMLSVDGHFECYVLEDVVREVPDVSVQDWKVRACTAIPQGRYQVARTFSPRFGKVLPLLVGVKGFDGIRIHPGNVAGDTEGCLLPGLHKAQDKVTDSRAAFLQLDAKIKEAIDAGETVWIDVKGLKDCK